MLLPFYQPTQPADGCIILAGDLGATKTNIALYRIENGDFYLIRKSKLNSGAYDSITGLIKAFIQDDTTPDKICFGVAGPVLNGHVKLSNLKWEIDRQEINALFPAARTFLINDLQSTAYGLALLDEKDVHLTHKTDAHPSGNAAVIAPGTGLGEAGIYWDGTYYYPFASEGGHCDFAVRSKFDYELFTFLQNDFGHVSWERLVCGNGIINIYRFLRDIKKMEEPEWLRKEMETKDRAATISSHADKNELCKTTMDCFIRYLAYESANLVLKFAATGGLFIGGGIVPKIIHLFNDDTFYSAFRDSGRLSFLLEKVPVRIILNDKAALLGASYYAATH